MPRHGRPDRGRQGGLHGGIGDAIRRVVELKTLAEESAADSKLTAIAESEVLSAASEEGTESEEDQENDAEGEDESDTDE